MNFTRIDAITALVPAGGVIVDVGADHGRVASRLGAIATERAPGRRVGASGAWVIADGLRPFRRVDTAVIAGMGARTIAAILQAGPRPQRVVAHADDDPALLRVLLASAGWQIDAELVGWNGSRLAEVVRAIPGEEPSAGLPLELGPQLLQATDGLTRLHYERLQARWAKLAEVTVVSAPARSEHSRARATFLEQHLAAHGWQDPPKP